MKNPFRALIVTVALAPLFVPLMAWDAPLGPENLKPQTLCPVMGGAIDSTIYTDYQGQRVYFCCPGCVDSFLSAPEKYFERAAADSILFESVQTICPVMGNPINRDFWVWHMGRGVYFCFEHCIGTFLAEPRKYLDTIR
ncbi:MAG: YHS domain-containing protein [Candidatus Krumholzibacteria bacterium]|nr:YHS domain-containing protein [Candidatus Krumholzibacteria bacterium]